MSDGLFALGGAALGFVGALAVQWMRQRSDKRSAAEAFQRATLLELQEVTDEFLRAMTDIHRHTAAGAIPPGGAFDAEAEQDHARSLLRRIRILSTRARDRQVETMAADVFQKAYGALAASSSMADAYRSWEALNDYIGNLVR
jgi:hypothetical protein